MSPARLFGITFAEQQGIPAWHPDVRVFEVRNADGSDSAFSWPIISPGRRSAPGAWMSALQSGYRLGEGS